MEGGFRNLFYEILIFSQILAGTLFSVKNNRWILFKRKIAEKVDDSDFWQVQQIDSEPLLK